MKSHVTVGFGISQSPSARFTIYHFLLLLWICFATGAQAQSPPLITVEPTNQSALFFGSAVFSVQAQSTLPVSYQWIFNGEPIPDATNADLILGPLNCAQNGYYNVIISNVAGAVSSVKAQLTVYQTVFSSGYDSDDFQNFVLPFTNIMLASAGSFDIYALTSQGTIVSYAAYTNSYFPPASAPNLTDVVSIFGRGSSAVLGLTGEGIVAAWAQAPTNIPGGISNVIGIAATSGYNLVLQSNGVVVEWGQQIPASPRLSNVVSITGGNSEFLALNAAGAVYEWNQNAAPQLVPGVSNIISIAAGGAFMGLRSDGTLVAWSSQTTNPLPGVSNLVAMAISEDNNFLALKSDGTVTNEGTEFPIALSNVFGITCITQGQAVAFISNGAPVFTVQPDNQFPTNGGTIWLHARGVGVQPMSYQWQLNGANIPGATNAELTITNAQEMNAGQYSALASNVMGTAASRFASVAISPAPAPYTLAQALDATNLSWRTFGNLPWFPEVTNTHDGIAAAQSGAIGNSMSSGLETIATGPGTLTFWWSVSSEEFFDFLNFYIDGSGTNYAARISGEVNWEQEAFPITTGTHTLSWVYAKDPDVSVGEDAGWVSEVNFVPSAVQLGSPSILPNGIVQFSAFSSTGTPVLLEGPLILTFEVSSDLVNWTPLTNAVVLTNGTAQLSDPGGTNATLRFYRLLNQ
jgi:hypothetical protein